MLKKIDTKKESCKWYDKSIIIIIILKLYTSYIYIYIYIYTRKLTSSRCMHVIIDSMYQDAYVYIYIYIYIYIYARVINKASSHHKAKSLHPQRDQWWAMSLG